jgi:hypothetical protein
MPAIAHLGVGFAAKRIAGSATNHSAGLLYFFTKKK